LPNRGRGAGLAWLVGGPPARVIRRHRNLLSLQDIRRPGRRRVAVFLTAGPSGRPEPSGHRSTGPSARRMVLGALTGTRGARDTVGAAGALFATAGLRPG